MENQIKNLYRSRKNKIWLGIIGGVGEYLNVDPSALRLAYIILMFLSGFFPLLFAYIVAAFIIPLAPLEK